MIHFRLLSVPKALLIALCALTLPTGDAFALPGAPPSPPAASRNAPGSYQWSCGADEAKFCPKVDRKKPGAMRECLDQHEKALSASCRTMRTRMLQAVREWQAACGKDMGTLCAAVKPGDYRGRETCLQKNESRLSPACKAERKRLRQRADARLKQRQQAAPPAAKKPGLQPAAGTPAGN